MPTEPASRPRITLDASIPPKQLEEIRDNFSAICFAAGHLFLGGDEGTSIDRVTPESDGNFAQHRRFDLAPILGLPASGGEIDIEGLDFDGGYLWLTGSHSLKRGKPDKDLSAEENRERLATVKPDANRYTLARIALDPAGVPAASQGALRSARLTLTGDSNQLFAALAADPLLGRFATIPSKDNGIDIEGLAVRGERVFLGMRGPVLRGWAVILEIAIAADPGGALAMKGGLKKHLLQLAGLGVRELAIDGKDMYILAGPTMDLDGPVYVFKWPKALDTAGEAMVRKKDLPRVLEIPFGTGKNETKDHAEGIALSRTATGARTLTVSYDSPADTRLVKDHPEQLLLDVFGLPG